MRSKQQAVSVRDDDGVEDDDEDRADDRVPHPHLLSDDRDCEIGRPSMRNPAEGGETEEEHNDLRAVRSSLSDRRRSRRCRCRPVDGGVLKCKIQKERIGRRGRRFRLLIMKKKNDFR